MKKSELRQLIREELQNYNEASNKYSKMSDGEFNRYVRTQYQKHQKQNLHSEDRMDYGEFYDEFKSMYRK